MDLQLRGKSAIVTGGTRGIGRAMAEMFAEEGVNVAICAREPGRVADQVKALESRGVKAFGKSVDVADSAALQLFIRQAADAFGGIDIYVSNATSEAQSDSDDAWQAAYSVDLMAARKGCEIVLPFLEAAAAEKGDAAFLAIASMAATMTAAPDAYGAMKAALIHYVKGQARALASRKVRFNTICPGTIYAEDGSVSRMKRESPERYEMLLGLNPTGRMGKPEEIGAMAVFLCSPRSSFTTGSNILVEGGLAIRVNF